MDDNKVITKDINSEFSLDDLGEFSTENLNVTLEEENVVLSEDLDGFAKGFPNWDLLPPKAL